MIQPTYRTAVLADLRAVCALGREVQLFHHEARPDMFVRPNDAAESEPLLDEAHWRPGIEGGRTVTFLAELDGTAIGFLAAHLTDDHRSLLHPIRFAHVDAVCVTSAHRGKGVGRALMAMAEAWAIASGAVDMRLNVWRFNAAAVHLYEELGYEVRTLHMGKSLGEAGG